MYNQDYYHNYMMLKLEFGPRYGCTRHDPYVDQTTLLQSLASYTT